MAGVGAGAAARVAAVYTGAVCAGLGTGVLEATWDRISSFSTLLSDPEIFVRLTSYSKATLLTDGVAALSHFSL